MLPAARLVDIDRMIHLAAELKLKPVLYGLGSGYKAADLLVKAKVPVLISLKWPERPVGADPELVDDLQSLVLREEAPSTPRILAKAKVPFAFYSDGMDRPADTWKAVKRAMDAGLSADDAVRAMTLSTAEIFGVADRMGSVDKGKIANLIITKGDLFLDATKVQYVIIDGNKYEPTPEAPTPDAPPTSQEEK
jgi:imidazolonepropionase-like amidohydrolase